MKHNRNICIKQIITICFCVNTFLVCNAQDSIIVKPYEINGYIHYNQTVTTSHMWAIDNQIHNRINAKWYISPDFSAVIEMRNRIFYGDAVQTQPNLANIVSKKSGYVDLTYVKTDGNSWIVSSMFDRMYLDYKYKNMQLTAGRQRINWGRCIAWNPNDVFNTASFFDVDYKEKSGSDAIRFQYYIKETDQIEIAAKLDNNNLATIGGLYKFNTHNYDIQLIGGVLQEHDAFVGFGWEGYIKKFSFRGESNYFYPLESMNDTSGTFLISIGTDYITSNNVFFQIECMYSQYAKTHNLETLIGQNPLLFSGMGNSFSENVKTISFDRYAALLSVQYPVTPLLNVGIAGMYFVDAKGYFINPSLTYSLTQNIDFSLIGQYFNVEAFSQRYHMVMLYGLLSWNF